MEHNYFFVALGKTRGKPPLTATPFLRLMGLNRTPLTMELLYEAVKNGHVMCIQGRYRSRTIVNFYQLSLSYDYIYNGGETNADQR